MTDLAALLAKRRAGRPLLLDGGVGSELIARGLAPDGSPERWNLERPEQVAEVHRGFVTAGSEVLQTNTFGGNALALARHGLADQVAAINEAGARLAREAGPLRVAGNMGPSGLLFPPQGEAEPDALERVFAEQATALAAAGVDYLALETMFDLREALSAVRGAATAGLPVTVCLTLVRTESGFQTPLGDPLAEALQQLAAAGATAVGANCSGGSGDLLAATPALLAATSLPVIVKPNAGLPEPTPGGFVYRQDPEDFARDVTAAARAGAAAVGGCCGAGPAFIAALARRLA